LIHLLPTKCLIIIVQTMDAETFAVFLPFSRFTVYRFPFTFRNYRIHCFFNVHPQGIRKRGWQSERPLIMFNLRYCVMTQKQLCGVQSCRAYMPPPPPHSSSLESVVPGSGQAVVPSVYLCLGPKHSTIPVVYTLGTPFVGTALGYQELTKDAPIRF